MKTALTLLIAILFIDLAYAQHLVSYQRPEIALTEYQQLYAENLVQNTKTYQLKGNVKLVTITLLDRDLDSLTFTSKYGRLKEIKSYFEIYKFQFLPNKKLQTYEVKYWERERFENAINNPKIDTITKITSYYFNEENDKLLKIMNSHSDSYGFHGETTKEKYFDSLGFLKQEISFNIQVSKGKQMFWTIKYEWNQQRDKLKRNSNNYGYREDEQKTFSFKDESYEKATHLGVIKTDEEYCITGFDMQGNIISVGCYEPDIRSLPPNNYNISYKYNENNELIEISKNGSEPTGFFNNKKTVFTYGNYDKYGNWQEMTISTTDDNGKYTKLKYKREISYY